jgi:tRNA modification GTPase
VTAAKGFRSDTIAAIATGTGGGVGVVRISGPDAEAILRRLVDSWPKSAPSHKLHLGRVRDPETREVIDEVLACVMRAPRSYTGEEVAELQGHGGARILDKVLSAVLSCGARLAAPGEFTRRAFEAGKIDLVRAEAVAELIAARSERALRAAQAVRSGELQKLVAKQRRLLVTHLAELDGALDFPDEANDEVLTQNSADVLREAARELEIVSGRFRALLNGEAEVVLGGRTNAGKSSLLNALCGEERALVDDRAGTTRDVVEAVVEIEGATLRLIDTAGERFDGTTESSIEERGLALGRRRRDRADAVALVVDGTVGFGEGERQIWRSIENQPRIIIWNKRDVSGPPTEIPEHARVVETSAATGVGIALLKKAIFELLGDGAEEQGVRPANRRQAEALIQSAAALYRAASALDQPGSLDLAAVEARRALHHLGQVTGETAETEVLDAIFARFCIGK